MSIPFETSPALAAIPGLRHAYFGRRGGVSTGDFASLNVSDTRDDQPDHVRHNRAIAAATVGFGPEALVLVRQTHSSLVHAVTAPFPPGALPEGDALVTATPGLSLGILTADCAPVLLADPEAGIAGAFHAGWQGAVSGVAEATVAAMAALGARRARIVAAIGPTISLANYEVGPEFAASVLAQHPSAGNRIAMGPNGRERFDLAGFVADQLQAAGVGAVDSLGRCTYAEPAAYFSHRFATHRGTSTGRQIAIIGLA